MSLFVTVGSTSFDKLIRTICSDKCINLLVSSGFKEILIQIGNGNVIPEENSEIKIKWFRFKDAITDDIKQASLIIGHAGAGTVLESLYEWKPLIVVLNEELMDNHQSELAEKLAEEDYLKCATCSSLPNILQNFISSNFVRTKYDNQGNIFKGILTHILGLK